MEPTLFPLPDEVRVCTTRDVDDGQTLADAFGVYDARKAILALWSQVQFAQYMTLHFRLRDPSATLSQQNRKLNIDTMRAFLMYAVECPSRRRRIRMDVNAMVEKWMPIIRGLATAHDKATVDQCEFDSEEHLLPLTSAPIAQLREFYSTLCARLEADPSIPFFVWRSFRTWGDVVLKGLPDGSVKKLRGDLAKKVADLVEQQIQPDLNAALVGALQWRDAGELQQIATAVEGGAKPRMRGRESCLFLVVDNNGKELTVML